ncbi:MAG: hypothetical protein AAF433_06655 [Bacteroidota bacterium]
MKIRIKDASIRLRLSMDDMSTLAQQGRVVAVCPIAPGVDWEYGLLVSDQQEAAVSLQEQGIQIRIPREAALSLTNLSEVGHSFLIDNGTSAGLSLLIERDFKCLVDRPGEAEGNLYPNPLARE